MDAQRRHIGSNVPLIDQGEEQEDHEVGECAEFTTRGHVDVVGDDVRQVSDPSDLEAMCRSTDSVHVADFWDGIVFTVPRMEEESLDAIQEPDDMTSDGKPSRFQAVPVPEDQLENTSSGDSIQDPRMCSELGDDTHMRIDDVIQSTCARMPSGSAMRAPPVPGLLPKTLSFADPSTYQTLRYETVDDPSDDTGSGLSGSGSDVTSQRRESSDSSSYYDTVSSTSSTAALLQKVKVTPQVKIEVIECETSLPQQETEPEGDDEFLRVDYACPEFPKALLDKVEGVVPEVEYTGMQSSGTGQALLAQSLEHIRKSFENLSPVFSSSKQDISASLPAIPDERHIQRLCRTYLRNLVVLSLGFMFCFTAFFSLRNLMSSINHDGGLGLISLSVIYGSFIIGCVFAPSVVYRMGPKYALVVAFTGMTMFVVSNFYPRAYTLIPGSAILGFSLANLWTAQGTYITSLALTYAAITNKDHDAILGVFNGFFLFTNQVAMLLGNLISSFVFNMELEVEAEAQHQGEQLQLSRDLNLGNRSLSRSAMGKGSLPYFLQTINNSVQNSDDLDLQPETTGSHVSFCGAAYCHSYVISHAEDGAQVQPEMLHILLGVYTAFSVVGVLTFWVFLDKLDVIFRRTKTRIARQLVVIFSLHKDRKLLALIPMMTFLGIEETFMFGEITKAFVTCPLGVHMIGYAMVCFGACGAVGSFVCGNSQKCFPRPVIICFGAALNLGLLFGMYFWQPSASQPHVVFILAGAWGVTDSVWQTQLCSMCGLLFPHRREAAFANLRMYESVGFTLAAAYAQFLCMGVKIHVTGGALLLSVIGYFVMESLAEREKREFFRVKGPVFL